VRDFETAEVAIKAAMTGHLVLSTLHTNDAPSSINRLMNMGIEPFLVATSVHLIAAQRLVRRICSSCRPMDVPARRCSTRLRFKESRRLLFGAGGTAARYRLQGRARHEVMDIHDDIRELILSGASAVELRTKAIENGMITLRGSGLQKIRDGVTTIDEVVRETVL
jgi:type IV pilus assembly protein PilB